MEDFPEIVRTKLGLNLTSQELTKLFLKYYITETNRVDYEKLTRDMKLDVQRTHAADIHSMLDKERDQPMRLRFFHNII
jgi:Ca2+-binding EF-hand superfamily protein